MIRVAPVGWLLIVTSQLPFVNGPKSVCQANLEMSYSVSKYKPPLGGISGSATVSMGGPLGGIGFPCTQSFSRGLFFRPLCDLPVPQTNTVARYVQGAVHPLLHRHLLCPYPVLYLVEPAIVGYGVVVPHRALGLYAEVLVQVEVPGKPYVHVRLVRRRYPERPVVHGQIPLEELVGLLLRLYPP